MNSFLKLGMTPKELIQLMAEVQKCQSEFDHVEVKAARGGTRIAIVSNRILIKVYIRNFIQNYSG